MFDLSGKTALVTGASQGIGTAISRCLAARGATVVLAARSVDKLEELAEEIESTGGMAVPLALDISNPEQVDEALARLAGTEASEIDILINNAGITRDGLFARMSLDQWQSVLDTNLTGSFAVTRALIRPMLRRRRGRIVFISSVVAMMGNTGQANYAASKAALFGLTKTLARELGSRSITVNAIAPGYIETPMTAAVDDRAKNQLEQTIALKRNGTPEEVAAAALFLVSDEASYITGEILNVSGGMYM